MGTPAVPPGSPSSLAFWTLASAPMTYAQQLWFAPGCCARIRATNSCASASVAAGASAHRKRERLTSVSWTPSAATVTYSEGPSPRSGCRARCS